MPLVNETIRNFVGGELGPSVRARSDIKIYANGCERIENFMIETTGPVKYRTGSVFVNPTRRNALARFIPFQYSDAQAYLIECTPGYFRFYKDNGIIVHDEKTITDITSDENGGIVTCNDHGFENEDEVFIYGVKGMEFLNAKSFVIKDVTANTFRLYDNNGENAIDTSAVTYISGGVLNKIVEVKTPYNEIDGMSDNQILEYLHNIQFTQNTDTMYVVHPKYPPRKLTRSSHTSWKFETYSRTSDYMTGEGKYPGAVAFDGAGRIIFAKFADEPDLILMSCGPDSSNGSPRYDNFTTGTKANDAIKMYLSSANGKAIVIKWLAVTDKYFIIGTEGGLLKLVPSDGYDNAFSAETLPVARPINSYACADIAPVPKGNLLFYFQKGSLILRCLEYDLVYDSYKSVDKNLVSDVITSGGCSEIVLQSGRPDILWIPKKNGKMIGLTYHETEDVAGWYRFLVGGNEAKVFATGIMPRTDNHDQLWLMVERKINGKIRRYVEYMADFEEFLTPEDFYTDEANKALDEERYYNDMFERQKLEKHLDCCLTYDGSVLGIDAEATITIGDIIDNLAVFTSDKEIFNESDLDRQIWRLHNDGIGSGRAVIIEYIDAQNVKCKILKSFDIKNIGPGNWTLTTDDIKNLDHLEGETVSIVADGTVHPDCVVTNGGVKLNAQADVVHIGYKYRGMVKTMNLNIGGTSGSAQNKPRNINKFVIEFLNSLGMKIGTDLYKLSKLDFRTIKSKTNRPSPLFSGPYGKVFDDKTAIRKHVYIVQDSPLPCTVQALDIFLEAVDD